MPRAPLPFCAFSAKSLEKIGITAASVLPEPVGATSRALFPRTRSLYDLLCIGVSSAQPSSRYLCSTWASSASKESRVVCMRFTWVAFLERVHGLNSLLNAEGDKCDSGNWEGSAFLPEGN